MTGGDPRGPLWDERPPDDTLDVDAGKEHLEPLLRRMIEAVRDDPKVDEFWPDVEFGPAHVVIADGNCHLSDIDRCIDAIRRGSPGGYAEGVPPAISAALAL